MTRVLSIVYLAVGTAPQVHETLVSLGGGEPHGELSLSPSDLEMGMTGRALRPDLEVTGLGHVLDALERLVLLRKDTRRSREKQRC